jgi:hypothetical protein
MPILNVLVSRFRYPLIDAPTPYILGLPSLADLPVVDGTYPCFSALVCDIDAGYCFERCTPAGAPSLAELNLHVAERWEQAPPTTTHHHVHSTHSSNGCLCWRAARACGVQPDAMLSTQLRAKFAEMRRVHRDERVPPPPDVASRFLPSGASPSALTRRERAAAGPPPSFAFTGHFQFSRGGGSTSILATI